MPSLDGKTITADPLHCQKETARLIAEKGGEYFLQIKSTQWLPAHKERLCAHPSLALTLLRQKL